MPPKFPQILKNIRVPPMSLRYLLSGVITFLWNRQALPPPCGSKDNALKNPDNFLAEFISTSKSA